MSANLLQHHGTSYHLRRVVCITVVPSYDQSQYIVEDHVETKVRRLIEGLGPNCRVSKFQWLIATDEPCGAILQDLSHEGVDNVLTFSMLIATDWKFWCKPRNETDEWEFDGLGAFLQQQLVDPAPLNSSSAECLAVQTSLLRKESEANIQSAVTGTATTSEAADDMLVQAAERERRIRQFEHYLSMMQHRTLRLVKSDCFLVFSVRAPRSIRPRIGGSKVRIVQFAFMNEEFYLDLPDTTLTLDEAKRIVAERSGFEYALDRPQKRLGERQFDPVQRIYSYAEQRTAAEDTAYVLFDLWQTPVDAWIKVDASAFEVSRSWEPGILMG
jgi:hypothetical protein